MAKIIGLMCCWASEDFIVPALRQASEYCDEVLVNISAHSSNMLKFKDSTEDRVVNFLMTHDKNNVKLVDMKKIRMTNHSTSKAAIFNSMLGMSQYFEKGNWIWTLDVDEFYTKEAYEYIKSVIEDKDCPFNQILVGERFFYIDMKHYLKGNHNRLFKIEDKNQCFIPTQQWSAKFKSILKLESEKYMFHYSMLMNPHAKVEFWKTEYPSSEQLNKIKWIDAIYKNYELSDEHFWLRLNEKLFGIYSPWFSDSFTPREDGTLFVYDGQHPSVIEESSLTKVKDFREKFNFVRG